MRCNKILAFCAAFMILLFLWASCVKEYSFEGENGPPIIDTLLTGGSNPMPSPCPDCIGNDVQIENRWSLRISGVLYCGFIDTAIATPERTGFTFFGPSLCSPDSGMVITIYLNGLKLDHDISGFSTQRAGFYYYDNITPSYLVITDPGQPFSVTIDSYEHSTRLMRGKFNGFANLTGGGNAYVGEGKFKVKVL